MKIVEYTAQQIDAALGAISCDPEILPDFSQMSIEFLPVLLMAMMKVGHDDEDSIRIYLAEGHCAFEWRIVRFILDQFEGRQQGECLWTRHEGGRYTVLFPIRSSRDRSVHAFEAWSRSVR